MCTSEAPLATICGGAHPLSFASQPLKTFNVDLRAAFGYEPFLARSQYSVPRGAFMIEK